jgi:trigger factor
MEVHLEAPDGLKREMRVTIPADRVTKAIDERLRTMSQRAKLPGFRPGKAPLKVIQQQFGPSARMDAVSDLVQRSYPEALVKVGARPAGQPQINVTAEKLGEPLEYVARFEVQLADLSSMEIELPVVEVTEADVDRLVLNLRKGRRELRTVTRPAAAGDMVKLDFDGKVEGGTFAGGKGEGVEIELGAGQFLPDLENGIAGHLAGDEFEVPVSFPTDYRAENLRGKTAHFAVKLHEVKEIVLPSQDDPAFLEAHKVESVDALLAKAREALENEKSKAIQRRQKNQVLEQLAERNTLQIPRSLVEREIPGMRQQAAQRMNMHNVPEDKLAEMLPAQLFEAGAERKVKLGLLLGEVIKQKEVKLDAAKVEAALDAMARDFDQPEQVKAYYRSRPEMMEGLRAMVLEDQVVEVLLVGAAKSERPLSLEQLLNPQATA